MLLIEGGTAIDVARGAAERSDWLVLESGQLARLEGGAIPAGCDRLNARGHYLLPGLIDAHVHLSRPRAVDSISRRATDPDSIWLEGQVARVARQTIRAGVTLIRDLGDRLPIGAQAVEYAIQLEAPRVISAIAGLTAPNGYGGFLGEVARDLAELLATIRRRGDQGAQVIKLFLTGGVDFAKGTVGASQFDRNTVAAAVKAAHDLGIPVAAHANGAEAVMAAALAGVDTIEHGILIDDDGLRAMVERGICWVPTLLPLARALKSAEASGALGAKAAALRRIVVGHQQAVANGFDLGVKVIAGTDAGAPNVPHGCLVEELELMVGAGATPTQALKSATIWAADALGVGKQTGAIGDGRWADLLVLGGNPLEDVAVLREIAYLMCKGKVVQFDA